MIGARARLISLPQRRPVAMFADLTPAAREAVTTGALAAAAAAVLMALTPAAGDAPAHLYRTLLVREGVLVWDSLWYGGHYPLASYSLLYYLPAALVGNLPLVAVAAVVAGALFAAIAVDEWGTTVRWPARIFGVLVSGSIFTGTYSYALGLAALLATVRALQTRRPALAVAGAALTLGFSPLAFLFLCLVLTALLVTQRRVTAGALAVGGGVGLLAVLQLAALLLFPSDGVYPFRAVELVVVLSVCVLGGALALRARRAAPLAALFALWGAASVLAFVLASPVGENVTRLRAVVFPLVLLAALLAGFRPRVLAIAALAVSFGYNATPYVGAVVDSRNAHGADESFWAPAISYLERRSSPNFRVEVVPTWGHWEAYWLPRAGIPIARGWYRQLDLANNAVLYRRPLEARAYREWLQHMSVRFVVLPHTRLGEKGEVREARLLRSGRSGLVQVFASPETTIYEVPQPVGLLTGAGTLTRVGHSRIEGIALGRGELLLRIRYTPYWQVAAGALCVEPGPGGMTRLRVRRPGRFALGVPGSATQLVRAIAGGSPSRCRATRRV